MSATAEQLLADVRGLMRLACVRQYELAERLGISAKHMNQIFTGKVGLTFDMADRIADALGCELDASLRIRHER